MRKTVRRLAEIDPFGHWLVGWLGNWLESWLAGVQPYSQRHLGWIWLAGKNWLAGDFCIYLVKVPFLGLLRNNILLLFVSDREAFKYVMQKSE